MPDLVRLFFSDGNAFEPAELPPDLRDALTRWTARLRGEQDGVAFLPREHNGLLWWYAFAPDAPGRRELLGLLDAWVGPTASDLQAQRGRLDLRDAFDARLASEMPDRVLRFKVLPAQGAAAASSRNLVRRALIRLGTLLSARPPSTLRVPRPVSELLDDLGHAIAAQDLDLAETVLGTLREDGELDEVNLAYQRIRVLAGLERWRDLLRDPAVTDVLEIRRPPGVARALQQAVYEVYLSVLDRQERDDELVEAFQDVSERFAGLTEGVPAPGSRPELIVQFLSATRAPPEARQGWIDRLLTTADQVELGLRARLERLQRSLMRGEEPTPPAADPFEEAQARFWAGDALGALNVVADLEPSEETIRLAILAAADVGTAEAAARAIHLLEAATTDVIASVTHSTPFRAALEQLRALGSEGVPRGWADWFVRVEAGAAPDEAVRWVQDAGEDWTPLSRGDLVARVSHASEDMLAVVGEVAGSLLAAHASTLHSGELATVAEHLLLALALSGRTSAGIRVQSLNLVDALLEASPTVAQVETAMESLDALRAGMVSSGTVDWLVDLLQTVSFHPLPAGSERRRLQFVYDTIDDLRRLRTALDRTSLESIANSLASVGSELPDDLSKLRETAGQQDMFACLAGRRVVIYSLMKSASRRAAETLRSLVPAIEVETTAEYVASDRLAELSRTANVFVVVTAAAKHAATEFIEANRPGPVVYVNSKGTSALLRELEKQCQQ